MATNVRPVVLAMVSTSVILGALLGVDMKAEGSQPAKPTTKAPEIISETYAIKTYKLADRMQSYDSSTYVSPKNEGKVRLYKGTLELDHDLLLDWDDGWKEKGMIVTGDLKVSGNILNTNINGGPFLVVLGSVKARNLLSGGGEIYVGGDADIEHTCVGEYNDGVLVIKGKLTARLLIIDDHFTEVGTRNCPTWDTDDPKLKLSTLLVDDIEIEKRTDPYKYEYVDVHDEILPRLSKGLPILRDKNAPPRKEKTLQEWLAVVKKDPSRFEKVPTAMRTPAMCMLGLAHNGRLLSDVPPASKTREVCMIAVSDGMALEFVPEKFKDKEMCSRAVDSIARSLEFVPVKLRTPELCMKAVKKDVDAFAHVPQSLRTRELCLLAVTEKGDALQLVPQPLRTKELCLLAMKHGGSVVDVPQKFLNEELCLAVVQSNGEALEEIPEALRTEHVCLEAMKKDGNQIEHVPSRLRNDKMFTAAVKSFPPSIIWIDRMGRLTEALCLAAANADGLVLYHMPERFKTDRVCVAAVKNNDDAMKYVPNELQDKVRKALAANP